MPWPDMTIEELKDLCERAYKEYTSLPPRAREVQDIAQKMSFAWANVALDHPVAKRVAVDVMKKRHDPELVDEAVKLLGWVDLDEVT